MGERLKLGKERAPIARRAARGAAILLTAGLIGLTACSSTPSGAAILTLSNPRWDKVNVEVVLTTSGNCDDRGPGFVKSDNYTVLKDRTLRIVAPKAEIVCWRHDRNPTQPSPGDWSGWAKATLNPGESAETDI